MYWNTIKFESQTNGEFLESMKPEVGDSGSIALKGILDKFRLCLSAAPPEEGSVVVIYYINIHFCQSLAQIRIGKRH